MLLQFIPFIMIIKTHSCPFNFFAFSLSTPTLQLTLAITLPSRYAHSYDRVPVHFSFFIWKRPRFPHVCSPTLSESSVRHVSRNLLARYESFSSNVAGLLCLNTGNSPYTSVSVDLTGITCGDVCGQPLRRV